MDDAATQAAVPWITSFLERRGLHLRGKEAQVLAGYVLRSAEPHMKYPDCCIPCGACESCMG